MNANIVGNMVDHLDLHVVTLSCNNARARELSVYCHHALRVAQSCDVLQPYLHSNKKM